MGCEAPESAPRLSTHPARARLVPASGLPVRSVAGRPAVPAEVRAQANVRTGQPPLQLEGTLVAKNWADRRAMLKDEKSGDVRAYAIGDLVPYGGLLVGIAESSARVMLADAVVVRLDAKTQSWTVLEDFRLLRRRRRSRPRLVPALPRQIQQKVADAVHDLGSDELWRVQLAVESLTYPGERLVSTLLAHVDDPSPVAIAEVHVQGRLRHAKTRGDRVIAVLEAVTGQSFGDPSADRNRVVEAWRSWGGR